MLQRLPRLLLATGLALAFLAGPAPAVGPITEPANLYPHKQLLKEYVDSGAYIRDVGAVAAQANKYLAKRIAKGAKGGKKLAVVFDIDETVLSNLSHILANDFGYVSKTWDGWVAEGRAPAILSVQAVYETAVRANVDVFFITGRKESDRAGTEKNLRQVGYETWAKIFYRPNDFTETTRAFKIDMRRKLMADGYIIIANIGDQDGDLIGGYAEKWFKLPNPFYIAK